jgi:hypothetical protein
MKLKRVLFIDDGDLSAQIETISRKLLRKGCDLSSVILNPKDMRFQIKNVETGLLETCFSALKKEIIDIHMDTRYDIVACDFSFARDVLNGYDVIKWLINYSKTNGKALRKSKFVSYSSEEDKFVNNIIDNQELIKLIKLNIHAFYKRQHLSNELITLISKEPEVLTISHEIKEKIEKYGDLKFQNIYPPFEGKALTEIVKEIEADSHHGIEFQKYMIQLTVAHLVALNSESK